MVAGLLVVDGFTVASENVIIKHTINRNNNVLLLIEVCGKGRIISLVTLRIRVLVTILLDI